MNTPESKNSKDMLPLNESSYSLFQDDQAPQIIRDEIERRRMNQIDSGDPLQDYAKIREALQSLPETPAPEGLVGKIKERMDEETRHLGTPAPTVSIHDREAITLQHQPQQRQQQRRSSSWAALFMVGLLFGAWVYYENYGSTSSPSSEEHQLASLDDKSATVGSVELESTEPAKSMKIPESDRQDFAQTDTNSRKGILFEGMTHFDESIGAGHNTSPQGKSNSQTPEDLALQAIAPPWLKKARNSIGYVLQPLTKAANVEHFKTQLMLLKSGQIAPGLSQYQILAIENFSDADLMTMPVRFNPEVQLNGLAQLHQQATLARPQIMAKAKKSRSSSAAGTFHKDLKNKQQLDQAKLNKSKKLSCWIFLRPSL